MNFESLIFDIDGTLWDSRALAAKGYNTQLKEEGLERFCVDAEVLKPLFGKVVTELAETLFAELPAEQRSFFSITWRKPSSVNLPRPTSTSVPTTARTMLRRKRSA